MPLDYAKHQSILLQILKEIYSDTSIAPYLGFKGGTAAYLFYGLNRKSVDLDFDLLNESKEAEVFEKLQKIAQSHGKIIDLRVDRRNFGSEYELKDETLFQLRLLRELENPFPIDQ